MKTICNLIVLIYMRTQTIYNELLDNDETHITVMTKMKRFCVICGKELEIILDENSKIIGGGWYWKFSTESQGLDFVPGTIEDQKEYWECEECCNDED